VRLTWFSKALVGKSALGQVNDRLNGLAVTGRRAPALKSSGNWGGEADPAV
jgi:hypothetical protein